MRTRHFGHTDAGLQRRSNEDAWLADDELGLFVVCDGVGGRSHGEVASETAVELIWEWVKQNAAAVHAARDEVAEARRAVVGEPARAVWLSPPTLGRLGAIVRGALQSACYMVHGMGEVDPARRGMSTTASVALIAGGVAMVGQVGDSRVYLARGDEVRQVTEDHTLKNLQLKQGLLTPEQAQGRRGRSQITRALGLREFVEADIQVVPLAPCDRLLLCSDGLHEYLDGADALIDLFRLDVRDAARAAIRHANACGGRDNITALFVELLAGPP